MSPEDIKPISTSSEGVHVLKRYLEYAEGKGKQAIEGFGAEPDSDFEVEVANRLRLRGFDVEMQIGVSGFKIDLGVRHPDHPTKFIVGIECDGAAYHSSKSARDRDRLREEVLRGLGWEILRVWSTDWFDNPNLQTDRLVNQIKEIRTRPVPPSEDYVVCAAYASAASKPQPDQPERTITRELQVAVADGTKLDCLLTDASCIEAAQVTNSTAPSSGPLSESEVFRALREFRDTVIANEIENWEPNRSILRESMIETLVIQRVRDPDEWFLKVPQFQRSGTSAVEKQRYLDQICEIVERLGDNGNIKADGSPAAAQRVPSLRSPSRPETSAEHLLQ